MERVIQRVALQEKEAEQEIPVESDWKISVIQVQIRTSEPLKL